MASSSSAVVSFDNNDELVENFCSITGSDIIKAKKILEVCNWNLEMAVNMHVDSDYSDNQLVDQVPAIDSEGIRAPIPQSRAVLVEEDLSLRLGLRSRKRRSHSVFDGFRDFRAEAELQTEQEASSEAPSDLKKRRTLEDLFRPPLDIMYRGNFESARDFGEGSNKWLMVNLQDSKEFSCQVLNRDVWSDRSVKELVSRHFVFWQVYSDSLDGQRYMQFYKPLHFPYVAIIDPRTGENLVVWQNMDAPGICDLINHFLAEHAPSLERDASSMEGCPSTSKEASSEQSKFSLLDQSEEEQLKAALAASVEDNYPINVESLDSDVETFDSDTESIDKDMCKSKPLSPASDEKSNDSIDVVSYAESNGKTEKEKIITWKDFLGSDEDPKSDLVLRLPDGKREHVSWPCSSKLKALLLYIKDIGFDPNEYELVTNYPRRNLCQLDLWKSLKEVDLFPREMIIVQLKT